MQPSRVLDSNEKGTSIKVATSPFNDPPLYIKTYTDLASVKPLWQTLLAQCEYNNAFYSWDWVECWWKHFAADMQSKDVEKKLHILVVSTKENIPVGIFPFYEYLPKETLSRSELRPFGHYGAEEGMTEELLQIVHPRYEGSAINALLHHVARLSRKPGWDLGTCQWRLYLPLEVRPRPRFLGRVEEEEGRQVVYLPSTWEKYRASLSKSMRGNLNYYPRRLQKAGYKYTMRILTKPEEMREGVEHAVRLHHYRAESKRGAPHANHIPDDCQINFMHDCFERLSRQNMAIVGLLEINGEVIAAQAALVCDNELTLYYSGFDTTWYDYSPLTILLADMIADAITKGITRLNLLANPTFFRGRWGAKTETIRYTAYLINPHPSSVARVVVGRLINKRKGTVAS